MKIFAFTDLHSSAGSYKKLQARIKRENPDCVFCLGDFTVFEQNIVQIMRKISELGKPVMLLHGNHETEKVVERLCKHFSNITFVHRKIVKLGPYTLVGHGGGGFYGQGNRPGK